MFNSARWRSDKNKIKVVFKLHFHATQVSLSEGDSLMISMIPADVGKPTAKLEKVKVQNGGCYWEKPLYETVKFTQDLKTGKINERLYHFIIATALSKFGILGEVSFDFASYAGATKLSTVSLPLRTAKIEAVLHVSIERIRDSVSVDKRESEEGGNLEQSSQNQSLRTQLSSSEIDENIKIDLAHDGSGDGIITHVSELKNNSRGSIGSDVTILSSNSTSGLDTFQEFGTKNNSINEDHTNFISSQARVSLLQTATPNASTAIFEEQQRLQSEWSAGSAPDVSTDDSSNSPLETLKTERYEDTSDILIKKLKNEVAVLARQSEVSELELHTLRKNIVKESKRGQDLSRELISLKEERDAFREECKRLKDLQNCAEAVKVRNKLKVDGVDSRALLEELRQELNHQKDLNVTLRIQLQKTQESNSELIFAVRELEELLAAKNSEIIDLSNNSEKSESANSSHVTNSKCDADVDEDQTALVKDHSNAKNAYQLEQKVMDLYGELDTCRRDRDELEMQMEQLSLDYEILKQENHEISYKLEQGQLQEQLKIQYECSASYATLSALEAQIESLESDLQKQSQEFSGSLITISELENHVKSLEEELEKKEQGFESDLELLINAKVEQEKRAIQAEETLRKAQRQNVNTAERLQKELKEIYLQMSSTCDVNDNLATNALTEANEHFLEKNYLKEMLQQAKKELQSVKDLYEAKLFELSSQIHSKTTQVEQMQAEIEYKSKEIATERKHAEETHRLLSEEISLLWSEIGRLTQQYSFFSEQEKQNKTLRAVLEQMKASIDDLSEDILVFGSQIERLTQENSVFSEQEEQIQTLRVALEQMKASIEETEILVSRGITETSELELTSALLKIEVEKLQKELNTIRSVKDETESIAENLLSELENLKTKCGDLKHSVLQDELEKQILRKQVIQLTDDVKMRENLLSIVEKEMKNKNNQAPVVEVGEDRNAKLVSACVSMEDVNLIEKISLLEVAEDTEDLAFNDEVTEGAVTTADDMIATQHTSVMNGCPLALRESNNDVSTEQKLKNFASYCRDYGNFGEISNEMTLLKARNQLMEGELKDMQERYSAISLKFAEIEGERQKLAMKLRSIKNSKKSLS